VAEICTQVGIVEAGRLVAEGSLEEMQRRLQPHRRLRITLLGRLDEAQLALNGREGVVAVRESAAPAQGGVALEVDFAGDDAAVSQLLGSLVAKGLPVLHFTESVHDLEDVFMQATKGIVQ
jgi:ABC-2 type transport system ATP-binding protein